MQTLQIKHTYTSYPKIITITSCGWRATVTKNIANAGPNAIKMYPNSSTTVMFMGGNNKSTIILRNFGIRNTSIRTILSIWVMQSTAKPRINE